MTVSAPVATLKPLLTPFNSSLLPLSERLVPAPGAHEAAEAHALGDYERFAEVDNDTVAKLLATLDTDDEQCYQRSVRRMAKGARCRRHLARQVPMLHGGPRAQLIEIIARRNGRCANVPPCLPRRAEPAHRL